MKKISKKLMISPSVLDSDLSEIRKTLKMIEKADAEFVHFDVMDGNFVPNLTFGPVFMRNLKKYTFLPFDTHLMINHPEKYAVNFIDAGADIITFHIEALRHPEKLIQKIKNAGKKPGISLKPKTPVKSVLKYLPFIGQILVMSVEPGFGGQGFMKSALKKIKILRNHIDKKNYDCLIEVDGGINKNTAQPVVLAGADILVAGSAVFKSSTPPAIAIKQLRRAASINK